MDSAKKFPIWAWWLVGIAVIIGISALVVIFIRRTTPTLPPGLVERRNEVARIFDQSSRLQDVDIKPLVELEAEKDYRGAVVLMDQAMDINGSYQEVSAALVSVSDELTKLSLAVAPDEVGTKAINAFSLLAQLAEAQRKFYEDRRSLYQLTRNYYAELAAKKKPAIPKELSSLVDRVTVDLKSVEALNQKFSSAIKEFDDVIGIR